MRLVFPLGRPFVCAVAVGDDLRAWRGVVLDKALQRLTISDLDTLQSHAAWIVFIDDLDRTDEDHLPYAATALSSRDGVRLLTVRHVGLVHLDDAAQRPPFWIDHSATELVEKEPRGLVADDAELGLKLEG